MAEKTAGRESLVDSEVEDTDYVFIVDGDGDLKAVFMPLDESSEIPAKAKKLFKFFGINNPESVTPHTVH